MGQALVVMKASYLQWNQSVEGERLQNILLSHSVKREGHPNDLFPREVKRTFWRTSVFKGAFFALAEFSWVFKALWNQRKDGPHDSNSQQQRE
jgi:hypothetical protein